MCTCCLLYTSAQKFSDMSNLRPGDIKYKDLNGDGEVTSVDATAIGGTRIPEIVYGLSLIHI